VRVLDKASHDAVQELIKQHSAELEAIPGYVSAEPGFPIVEGAVLKEPAVIVFVVEKKAPERLLPEERMPRQLGPYRVAVMQADPLQQIARAEPMPGLAAAVTTAVTDLTYERLDGNPIDAKLYELEQPIVCHVGPDAGWPTLQPFLEATQDKLTVAMYDFNADYIATPLIALVLKNKIAMKLTWDDSMSAEESAIRKRLRKKLEGRLEGGIVLCGGGRRFASAYHEKVAVRDSSAFWLSSGNEKVFRSQGNIHNKGIIVDGKAVLVSSANWSPDGVLRNRDAGVIVYDAQVAKYFQDIFLDDWENRASPRIPDDPPVMVAPEGAPTPPGMVRMTWRDYHGE